MTTHTLIETGSQARPAGPSARTARRRRCAVALASVLVADGLVHLYWAAGMTWPASNSRTLSVAVLGFEVPFTPALLMSLAALLWATTAAVAIRERAGRRAARVLTLPVAGLTTALLVRALLGCWWAVDHRGLPAGFTWLNAVAYTPLCAALGACGLVLLAPTPSAPSGRRRHVARVLSSATATIIVAALIVLAYSFVPRPQTRYSPSQALDGVPSRYVDTPVARFHFLRSGHGSAVVLLSPGSAWAFAWLPQFRALAQTHTVYAVDLPGQGFTRLHERGFAFDLDAMTRAIGSFLDSQHLPTVALAGNSWSGGWALDFAQRHPARVDRLMLLDASGLARPDPPAWELLKLPLVAPALANIGAGSSALAESGARSLFVHQAQVTPGLLRAFRAANTLPDNLRATVELERRLDWTRTEAALGHTRQRTLILWGRQDNVLPVGRARTFAARMPHSQLQILAGCGHAITLDCPTRVSRLMTGFLDDR